MVLLKNNLVWSGYKSKEVYPKRSWKEKVDLANESYLTFLVTELLIYINIQVCRLGILFKELSSSNYLQIAFIFGLQTL